MKIIATVPASHSIETFLSFIKDRALDSIHENNVDLIADFIDRFLVIEMKRMASSTEVIKTEVEIPDELITKPLEEANKQLNVYKLRSSTYFLTIWNAQNDLLKVLKEAGIDDISTKIQRKFDHKDEPEELAPSNPDLTLAGPGFRVGLQNEEVSAADKVLAPVEPAEKVKRNGNGHQSAKVRDLTNLEKDQIRSDFLAINGQIAEDACLPIHEKLPAEISIFQVTGFISLMHRYVAKGKLSVKDYPAYENFLQTHRELLATYDNPKYQNMRKQMAQEPIIPKFTTFKK